MTTSRELAKQLAFGLRNLAIMGRWEGLSLFDGTEVEEELVRALDFVRQEEREKCATRVETDVAAGQDMKRVAAAIRGREP